MTNTLTINDLDVKSKRVLMRVDFNVPITKAGSIIDDKRIRESLPTIKKILNGGGRLVLMSHLGRPGGQRREHLSLVPIAKHLSDLLEKKVGFVDDCIGPDVERYVGSLKDGEVVLLQNLRFYKEETSNNPSFSKLLAALGDVYVNDAFGASHRAHASTVGVTKYLSKAVAGLLMKKELLYLGDAIRDPKRPFVAVLGGSKVSGKIDVIDNLMKKVDTILIGGAMIFTFFKSNGLEVGSSLVEDEKLRLAGKLQNKAIKEGVKLVFPTDVVISEKLDEHGDSKQVSIDNIPRGWMGLDIGEKTSAHYREMIIKAQTVLWNGPMGVFEIEKFSKGTSSVAHAMVEVTNQDAMTIVGGGDSASALAKLGLSQGVSHVSTGGGASLELLEGKILPGIDALTSP